MLKGSGVFVNTGNTYVGYSRLDIHRKFGIPCQSPPSCMPGDLLWCSRALQEGYDSIQVIMPAIASVLHCVCNYYISFIVYKE